MRLKINKKESEESSYIQFKAGGQEWGVERVEEVRKWREKSKDI